MRLRLVGELRGEDVRGSEPRSGAGVFPRQHPEMNTA
jgi:hypothetical protein